MVELVIVDLTSIAGFLLVSSKPRKMPPDFWTIFHSSKLPWQAARISNDNFHQPLGSISRVS